MDNIIKLEDDSLDSSKKPAQGSLLDDVKGWVAKLGEVDWKALTRSPFFVPGLFASIGLFLTFWSLMKGSFLLWKSNDYYSHGFIVPLLIGWQIKVRKPIWDKVEFKKGNAAWFFLIPLLALQYLAVTGDFWAIQSVLFIAISLTCCWLIFGFKKALAISLPIGFAAFALPLWGSLIDGYTNPLQILSTSVAETILRLTGFNPMKLSSTDIQLNSFTLNVAVPCSGLKLMVAVTCLTCHFILIARAGSIFNMLMLALIVPLCLLMNGLRIALIGMVGEWNGREAAMQFHDYSGMIMLVICFWVLFKFAKIFGWNG
jgi:exosortase